MKNRFVKSAAAVGLCLTMLVGGVSASAAYLDRDADLLPGDETAAPSFGQMDGRVIISEPGEYTLKGDMRGTVLVDPGVGDVKLILDGARFDGGSGPAIMAMSGDRLNIELADNSRNGMMRTPDETACPMIYSEVPVSFEGEGRLDMMGGGQEAIFVKDNECSFADSDIHFFEAPGMPGDDQQPGQMPSVPSGDQQPGQMPGMPGDSQQPGQMPAMPGDSQQPGQMPAMPGDSQQPGQMPAMPGDSQQPGEMPGTPDNGQQPGDQSGMIQSSTDAAGEIVTGITENSAMSLEADYDSAVTYDVSESSAVKITDSGTYIVTGTASEGSITVKKGTTGVVLVLENLDLTSSSGAVLSINKNAEVQVIISGNVTLTDNENPDDEYSSDEEVADAYDGAAIKVKAESVACITGDGTLTVNGNAENGIKAGDDSSLIIGGDVTININAVNDGINGNYDVTILSGNVNISAGDDGIHADHILTIGENGTGPNLTITDSNEGLEGTVVNIAGGKINVTATDDGINAANGDGVYEGELGYSVNITGGDVTVSTSADGIDSNGNVNLIGGSTTIRSASNGGDAGIDYDGALYIADGFRLNNTSGVAGPDGMGGMPGQMSGVPGEMGGYGSGMGGGPNGNMGGGFRP